MYKSNNLFIFFLSIYRQFYYWNDNVVVVAHRGVLYINIKQLFSNGKRGGGSASEMRVFGAIADAKESEWEG